jgi:hypothetical protein
VIAVLAMEAGIAWGFSIGYAPEEGLLRLVHPAQHVLQDLGMHLPVFGAGGLQVRQLRCLLIVGGALALAASPPRAALLKGDIVECPTAMQNDFQRPFLLGRWDQPILTGFAYAVLFHTLLF